MNSLRVFNRQAGFIVAIAALMIALVVPTFASADQVTSRSVQLSTASKSTSNVTYTVGFTPTKDAGAFVINFCQESPIIGETCTTPTGFSATGAAASGGFTASATDAQTVVVTGTLTHAVGVSVPITGITNPSATGAFYARIITYDTAAHAALYDSSQTSSQDANRQDEGGVALYITDTIGVTAAVAESMTFCVSAANISKDCTATSAPTLALGEDVNGVKTLSASNLSTGDIYTQISTNASQGAVINLKSNADNCGGLINSSASGCFITPATGDFSAGTANFGLLVNSATDPTGVTPSGEVRAVPASGYNGTTYLLNYASNGLSGVTSVFGDPVLDTHDAPANNKNSKLTFGASVSNTTPAGRYSADLSLIATGKF